MTTAFGIDFSLQSTGLTMFDGKNWDRATIKTSADGGTPDEFLDRMDDIAARIIAWCDPHDGDIWCLESPAFLAKSSNLDRMFGGWWSLYRALRDAHASPWRIQPQIIKQLATGKGNASKDAVLIQTVKRLLPLGLDVENNDEADSGWLAVAGAHIAGMNGAPALPQAHLKGLLELIRKGNP